MTQADRDALAARVAEYDRLTAVRQLAADLATAADVTVDRGPAKFYPVYLRAELNYGQTRDGKSQTGKAVWFQADATGGPEMSDACGVLFAALRSAAVGIVADLDGKLARLTMGEPPAEIGLFEQGRRALAHRPPTDEARREHDEMNRLVMEQEAIEAMDRR